MTISHFCKDPEDGIIYSKILSSYVSPVVCPYCSSSYPPTGLQTFTSCLLHSFSKTTCGLGGPNLMLLEPTSTNVAGTSTVLVTYEMEQTVCVTVSGGNRQGKG